MRSSDTLVLTSLSVIMTWVWYACQNATTNIYNVYRPVAPLIVLWNVIALGVLVVTVSTFLKMHCWRVCDLSDLFSLSMSYWLHWWLPRMRQPSLLLQCKSETLIIVINSYLRTTQMMITWMLVWIRLAKLLVNVFWIAMTMLAAKLPVCLPSKVNIPSALVRYVKLSIIFSETFS